MVVRCKFRLTGQHNMEGSVKVKGEANKWVKGVQSTYEFEVVGSRGEDKGAENLLFWDMTPAGKITITNVNPEVLKEFEMLKEYYVDFTEVPTSSSP